MTPTATSLDYRPWTRDELARMTAAGVIPAGEATLRGDKLVYAGPPPVPDVQPETYGHDPDEYRFTFRQHERMIEAGIFATDERYELLDGWVVAKMSRDPIHDGTVHRLMKRIFRMLPPGWDARCQLAVAFGRSQPEPDLAVVREIPDDYTTQHPRAADIAAVMEVAYSSLVRDLRDKARLYAAGGVSLYWVIDVDGREVEVFTAPVNGVYTSHAVFGPGQVLQLPLDGVVVAVAVDDILV